MSKIRFKYSFGKLGIDFTTYGATNEEIVEKLRDHIASKIPNIPFGGIGKTKAEIEPHDKPSWTNVEFFAFVVGKYNETMAAISKKGKKAFEPITVPENCTEFIAAAIKLGMAQYV